MKISHQVLSMLLVMSMVPAVLSKPASAEAIEPGDGGDGDYRTFYSNGKIEQGRLGILIRLIWWCIWQEISSWRWKN